MNDWQEGLAFMAAIIAFPFAIAALIMLGAWLFYEPQMWYWRWILSRRKKENAMLRERKTELERAIDRELYE